MMLHRQIQRIKKRLLSIGAVVEEQVDLAVKSIFSRDKALAKRVIACDVEIDMMEVDLEEECLNVLTEEILFGKLTFAYSRR